uniref:Regulator of chromosome condensation protein n=1 Tax=Pithovirus LCPAC202 TaxID=2506592 RepID=A0A481Z7M4_9VIRU|nr:MAG: regulator of chromosome condensation protein [Pithovirus LCPAC202]
MDQSVQVIRNNKAFAKGLTSLPNELLLSIFLLLDLQSLLAVCQINQQMRNICQDDFLWKQKFIWDFGDLPNLSKDRKWKEAYKTLALGNPNSPISVGERHYAVIDENGVLNMAGENKRGRLGFISDRRVTIIPIPVTIGPTGTKIISVSCSNLSTIAVTNRGQVYGTGYIDLELNGQHKEVKVFRRMTIPENVRKVSHSRCHYLFLLENKSVLMSGSFSTNLSGTYKPESDNIYVSRIMDIKAIDISVKSGKIGRDVLCRDETWYYSVYRYGIINTNHELYYWGTGFETEYPHLTDEQIDAEEESGEVNRLIHHVGLSINEENDEIIFHPKLISVPEQVKQISFGLDHLLILSTKGNLYVMGEDYHGQLGMGHYYEGPCNPDDTRIVTVPTKLPFPQRISYVSAGSNRSAAITEDGKLYFWGENDGVDLIWDNELQIYSGGGLDDDDILMPVQISLISRESNQLVRIYWPDSDSSSDEDIEMPINQNIHKVDYISLGRSLGLAFTRDGYLNFFGTSTVPWNNYSDRNKIHINCTELLGGSNCPRQYVPGED